MSFEEEDPLNICSGFDANNAEFPYADIMSLRRGRNQLLNIKKKALMMDRANIEELVAENDFLQMSLSDHLFRLKALSIQVELNSTFPAKNTNSTAKKHALPSASHLSDGPAAKRQRTTESSVLTLDSGSDVSKEAKILPNQPFIQASQMLSRAELCSLPESISGKPGAGGLLFSKTFVKTFMTRPFDFYHVLLPADEANHDTYQRYQYFGLYSLRTMTSEDFHNFSQSVQSGITRYLVGESGKDNDGLQKVLSGKTKSPVFVMKFVDVKGYDTSCSM